MQIYPGTFASAAERGGCTEKERRVLETLDALGIPYTGIAHEHADTIADCHAVEWEDGEFMGICDGSQELVLVRIPEP